MKENKEIRSSAHSKYCCRYHIVFAPKHRRQVIYGQIKKDVGESCGNYACKKNRYNQSKGVPNAALNFCTLLVVLPVLTPCRGGFYFVCKIIPPYITKCDMDCPHVQKTFQTPNRKLQGSQFASRKKYSCNPTVLIHPGLIPHFLGCAQNIWCSKPAQLLH